MSQERVDPQPSKRVAARPPEAAGEVVNPGGGETDFASRASKGNQTKNADPRRKYVLVHGSAMVNKYEERGFVAELVRDGGPYLGSRPRGESGQYITHMDGVLMSIDRAQYAQLQKHGDPDQGDMGTAYFDELHKKLLADRRRYDDVGGSIDRLRGQHAPGVVIHRDGEQA